MMERKPHHIKEKKPQKQNQVQNFQIQTKQQSKTFTKCQCRKCCSFNFVGETKTQTTHPKIKANYIECTANGKQNHIQTMHRKFYKGK